MELAWVPAFWQKSGVWSPSCQALGLGEEKKKSIHNRLAEEIQAFIPR